MKIIKFDYNDQNTCKNEDFLAKLDDFFFSLMFARQCH